MNAINAWKWTLVALLAASPAMADQVKLDVSLANPVMLAGKKQSNFLRTSVTGFQLASAERAPVNIALVLDKSGSMSGEKLQRAEQAAIQALDRLGPQDIVSVVVYDNNVQVLVPATKLTDKKAVRRAISQLQAGGSTALFAGVGKGAHEVRKFRDDKRVNRIILLSDGKANVGPQSPSELGQLGKSLSKENITVSTLGLGLGYNEDLMTQLAQKGGGNHVFIEDASQLASMFNQEFNDVLSVVAQEVVVSIRLRDGIRPVKLLGREGEINGQNIVVQLNQLYSRQEKYVLLEVEVPAGEAGHPIDLANVDISYENMRTNTTDRLNSQTQVNFSTEVAKVEKAVCVGVVECCVLQIANQRNKDATALRDRGDIAGAEKLLGDNSLFLKGFAEKYKSSELQMRYQWNFDQAQSLRGADWNKTRKLMRAYQYRDDTQQRPGK